MMSAVWTVWVSNFFYQLLDILDDRWVKFKTTPLVVRPQLWKTFILCMCLHVDGLHYLCGWATFCLKWMAVRLTSVEHSLSVQFGWNKAIQTIACLLTAFVPQYEILLLLICRLTYPAELNSAGSKSVTKDWPALRTLQLPSTAVYLPPLPTSAVGVLCVWRLKMVFLLSDDL